MLAVLFVFDPAQNSFYPQCAFKRLTGWDCPGCGGLRSVHQLLHGNVRAAFALNPLLFMLTPIGTGWLAARLRGWRVPAPLAGRAGVIALIIVVLLFTVLRNMR
ncbi:MAG: DUF2752 domain-containing protein [Verrucomicrobia bacterium]|nr:DUF2752 domain-containing protein [Verrucomicrobiota bacterium]